MGNDVMDSCYGKSYSQETLRPQGPNEMFTQMNCCQYKPILWAFSIVFEEVGTTATAISYRSITDIGNISVKDCAV